MDEKPSSGARLRIHYILQTVTFPDQQCRNVRAYHIFVCWHEKIRLNNQITELSVPQFSVTMNIRIPFSSPTHSPLSHASEHSRKKNRLMYKQVDKWYSALHCLILTYICSSEDSYLRKGIEKLSCTHKSQTNSHFTSDEAVNTLYTVGQSTSCFTTHPKSPS